MATIKVLSLNCRQWTRDLDKTSPYYWRTRMEKIAEVISEQQPDILCLQELTFPATRYIPKEYKRVTWGFSHSIWIRRTFAIKACGRGWRVFADYADIKVMDSVSFPFRIINVHGRWNKWARRRMLKIFDKWRHHCPTIAMGDFNNTYEQMEEQMEEEMLTYWEGMPLNKDTFINFTNPDSHGEIDLALHSPAITLNKLEKVYWSDVRASDHWAIMGEFEV